MTMRGLWGVGRRRKIVWTYSVPVPAMWRCLVPSWTIVDLAEGIAGEGRGKRNGQDIAEHVRQSVSGDRGERDCGMWTYLGFGDRHVPMASWQERWETVTASGKL